MENLHQFLAELLGTSDYIRVAAGFILAFGFYFFRNKKKEIGIYLRACLGIILFMRVQSYVLDFIGWPLENTELGFMAMIAGFFSEIILEAVYKKGKKEIEDVE